MTAAAFLTGVAVGAALTCWATDSAVKAGALDDLVHRARLQRSVAVEQAARRRRPARWGPR